MWKCGVLTTGPSGKSLGEPSLRGRFRDFPSGPVVENLPSNAGDTASISGWGPNIPYAMGQVGPGTALNTISRSCPVISAQANTRGEKLNVVCFLQRPEGGKRESTQRSKAAVFRCWRGCGLGAQTFATSETSGPLFPHL